MIWRKLSLAASWRPLLFSLKTSAGTVDHQKPTNPPRQSLHCKTHEIHHFSAHYHSLYCTLSKQPLTHPRFVFLYREGWSLFAVHIFPHRFQHVSDVRILEDQNLAFTPHSNMKIHIKEYGLPDRRFAGCAGAHISSQTMNKCLLENVMNESKEDGTVVAGIA